MVDINASPEEVSGYDQLITVALEQIVADDSFLLGQTRVHADRVETICHEYFSHSNGSLYCIREHNRLVENPFLKQFHCLLMLLLSNHTQVKVFYCLYVPAMVYYYRRRLLPHQFKAFLLYTLRKNSREHQKLLVLGSYIEQEPDFLV